MKCSLVGHFALGSHGVALDSHFAEQAFLDMASAVLQQKAASWTVGFLSPNGIASSDNAATAKIRAITSGRAKPAVSDACFHSSLSTSNLILFSRRNSPPLAVHAYHTLCAGKGQ